MSHDPMTENADAIRRLVNQFNRSNDDEARRLLTHVQTYGDCIGCDGYILAASEAPYCPTCARLEREKAL